jgi:hypothetical protein
MARLTNSVMTGTNEDDSIVGRLFGFTKGAVGGVAQTVIGLPAASIDGTIVTAELLRGATIKEALAKATYTRDTLKDFTARTGLNTNEKDISPGSSEQLGFILGSSFAPSRGIFRTGKNTLVNVGIEGVTDITNPLVGLTLSAIPGLGSRSTREVLAQRYSGVLDADKLERIKNGNITLGEITNDPKTIAMENRLRTDPATATQFRQFDAARADQFENRLARAPVGASPAYTPSRIAGDAYRAYEQKINNITAAKKAQADADYKRVTKFVPGSKPIVDSTPIVNQIDRIISENKSLGTDEAKAVVAGLERLRDNFIVRRKQPDTYDETGYRVSEGKEIIEPKYLSTDDLSKQLSNWSGKMYMGDGLFDKVSGDVSKRLARQMFNSVQEAIETQRLSLNRQDRPREMDALAALERARSNYVKLSDKATSFTERDMAKFFGNKDFSTVQSKPEQTLKHLAGLSPVERQVAFKILSEQKDVLGNNVGSDLINQFQQYQWNKLIDKSKITGSVADAPKFDIEKFVKNFDKDVDGQMLLELYPDPRSRAEVQALVGEMRTVMNRNLAGAVPGSGRFEGELAGLGAATTGTPYIQSRTLVNFMNDLKNNIIGPERLFELFTNPKAVGDNFNARASSLAQSGINILTPSSTDVGRAGRVMIEQFQNQPQQQEPTIEPSQPALEVPTPSPRRKIPMPPMDESAAPVRPTNRRVIPMPDDRETLQIPPGAQKERDAVAIQLMEEELQKAATPEEAARIQREIAAMRNR